MLHNRVEKPSDRGRNQKKLSEVCSRDFTVMKVVSLIKFPLKDLLFWKVERNTMKYNIGA